jgi:predicted RNase H-like nuclease (RuvC/YqgF family)
VGRSVSLVGFAALGALALLVAPPWAKAQAQQSGSSSDAAVNALVSEVRALRAEMAEASQRSLRFELLLARLQMQEQRVAYLDRQRLEISGKVFEMLRMNEMLTMQLTQMDGGCRDSVNPEEREQCGSMLEQLKRTLAAQQKRELDLRTQEGELLNAISTEQGRWNDFSARLDELERSLARR